MSRDKESAMAAKRTDQGNARVVRRRIEQAMKGGAIVSIQKCLIEAMDGDLVGGLFASQILFWAGKTKRHGGWFYRSHQQWRDEDYINRYQADKWAARCKEAGWLQTKVSKAGGAPVTHYRIDYARLALWLAANGLSISTEGLDEMDTSLDMQMSADPIQTHTYTNTQTAVSSVDAGGGSAGREAGDRAPEVGQKSAQDSDSLSELAREVAEVTGLSAAVAAGARTTIRQVEEAAEALRKMGYTSAESVRNLGNSWSIENDWRHTQPSIFNLTEYASRLKQGRRPSGSLTPQWCAITDRAPDYMEE